MAGKWEALTTDQRNAVLTAIEAMKEILVGGKNDADNDAIELLKDAWSGLL